MKLQFPKELRVRQGSSPASCRRRLNEVQFPKELRDPLPPGHDGDADASMKCSSRRNCDLCGSRLMVTRSRLNEVQFPKELRLSASPFAHIVKFCLNEVQFPKELRLPCGRSGGEGVLASMKCSSRRNCDPDGRRTLLRPHQASMKCSSRRNCDPPTRSASPTPASGLNEVQFPKELRPGCVPGNRRDRVRLNEVQFPKELRHGGVIRHGSDLHASMKCGSRRNCDLSSWSTSSPGACLNEVQFPKELRLSIPWSSGSTGMPQ